MKTLTFFMIMLITLLASCSSSSTDPSHYTPTSPASIYSAEISGRVTVANKVVVKSPKTQKIRERTPIGNDRVWWIVEVSVKNHSYENPITSTWDKSISMPVGEET
jgi:uncharacterized lipoprotein YmbA